MGSHRKLWPLVALSVMAVVTPSVAGAAEPAGSGNPPTIEAVVSGLQGASGSTIGPDGALYVTEAVPGRITRVDPRTGETSTFASGLPVRTVPNGGVVDVAFVGRTAYALVSRMGAGIYRIDGPNSFSLVADLATFSSQHPPADTTGTVPTGVQFAMETYRGGFLVTDGNHNRVLHVTRDGKINVFIAFGNIVPTGLEVQGNTVYMAQAGPVPHLPQDGKVVAFTAKSPTARDVASGRPLLVDVELGRRYAIYGLAQGIFPVGQAGGSPAAENTGQLLKVNGGGTFTVVVDGLNRPSSVEFLRNTAYVVTLTGEILEIANVFRPRHDD